MESLLIDKDTYGVLRIALQLYFEACETAADLAGETDELTERWNKVEKLQEKLEELRPKE